MGHIVNAKSMRIGWSTIWCDQWYSEFLYYPEYLHAIFRIRFFLIYTFTRRHFDKKAIFYSHFEILKHFKNFYVEVYYYSGKVETDFEDFKFKFFKILYNLNVDKDAETRKPKFLYTPLKLLVVWSWIQLFNIDKKSYGDMEVFDHLKFLRLFKKKKLRKFLQETYLKKLDKKCRQRNKNFFVFLFLFSIYYNAKIIVGKSSIWKRPRRYTILRRLYMLTASYREMHFFIYVFSNILGYIFEKLSKFYLVVVDFFLTNNNCVNAKFLSRFIARKLKQNYPVKKLLNPIRKELSYVIRLSACPRKSYNNIINKKLIMNINNKNFKRSLFKALLSFLYLLFNKHLLSFFKCNKIWITLDILIIYVWYFKIYKNSYDLIKYSKFYFLKKCIYLCFFEKTLTIDSLKYLFLPKFYILSFFSKRLKYLELFSYIYEYFYVNKFSLLNFYNIDIMDFSVKKLIKFSCLNFNRFLKFNYWMYNYNLDNKNFKVNHLKSRIKIHTRANNIRGYKMHLFGRFTRKQRAAAYWFSKGKVPLNSIMSFVDYSFFTIPLKNSAITVKVWLYKSDDLKNIYYLKIT